MPKPFSADCLEAATAWFEDNFRVRGEIGAALSVWRNGEELLHLSGGSLQRDGDAAWTADTLVPVWSSTKGVAALACVTTLLENGVDLDRPVVRVWPAFAGGGKGDVTFRQVLSHTAGLAVLDEVVSILDYEAVVRALERQKPLAAPGTLQAYHPRTFGFLLDEIVRRVSGAATLSAYYEERLRKPMDAEFWIGLPPTHHDRVATLYTGRMSAAHREDPFMRAFQTPDSLTVRAFQSPHGLNAVADFNRPDTWTQGFPAMGGVGSARALGRMYAALAIEGDGIVPAQVPCILEHTVTDGEDAVLRQPMAFSAGMMKEPAACEDRLMMGTSRRAFGHPGAGGSLCFADPENRASFAYVMNQMELGVLPGEKALGLVRCLYGQARDS